MAYKVRVKKFEGPLELLYDLIETKKLSINEVSLGSVTEDYFRYIEDLKAKLGESYHEELADFLVIASTLILIKSRSLLPGFMLTREEEVDIKELEDRLKAYQIVKHMADALGARVKARQELFGREPLVLVAPSFLPPAKGIDLNRMIFLLREIITAIPQKNELPQRTVKKIISIEEKIKELEERISSGMVKTFHDFVGNKTEKVSVVVTFLAMLELIKLGAIAVRQSSNFDLIHIEHGRTEQQ
ncbi:MAG: hypothetical protein EXS68_00065 [Candidatus Ryanbacteria bacterium]|nr:hypothetical protein [Candidatus Ryanbacteria bacterium]